MHNKNHYNKGFRNPIIIKSHLVNRLLMVKITIKIRWPGGFP